MRRMLFLAALVALVAGCASSGPHGHRHGDYRQYDYDRPDPQYGHYDASRYYRDDPRYYPERRMTRNDRIYRGGDGRYYCRRSDGTTGLVVGGITGGMLGAIIAPRDSRLLGALIGTGIGAAIGHEIDRGNVRCR